MLPRMIMSERLGEQDVGNWTAHPPGLAPSNRQVYSNRHIYHAYLDDGASIWKPLDAPGGANAEEGISLSFLNRMRDDEAFPSVPITLFDRASMAH